jgi:hypothetical protein
VINQGYVVAGYVITFLGLGAYGAWILVRGRRLSAKVPEERRRWM